MSMEPLRISAKQLGEMVLPGFCPRCFWLRFRLGNRLPYRTPPPGIFSSIDSYTKRYVERQLMSGKLKDFLPELTSSDSLVREYRREVLVETKVGQIILSGIPDAIFHNSSGNYTVVDYKTARFTNAQKSFLPMYEVQLRSYSYILQHNGINPVQKLLLVYLEPKTADEDLDNITLNSDALYLKMQPFTHIVEDDQYQILKLAENASKFLSGELPSPGIGCENCLMLENILRIY